MNSLMFISGNIMIYVTNFLVLGIFWWIWHPKRCPLVLVLVLGRESFVGQSKNKNSHQFHLLSCNLLRKLLLNLKLTIFFSLAQVKILSHNLNSLVVVFTSIGYFTRNCHYFIIRYAIFVESHQSTLHWIEWETIRYIQHCIYCHWYHSQTLWLSK